uniref:Uncharacterized protein n=1 Tax=Cacopsylla melanoneura TaxID=428564 RepID=A0A8D9APS8_9HEMI
MSYFVHTTLPYDDALEKKEKKKTIHFLIKGDAFGGFGPKKQYTLMLHQLFLVLAHLSRAARSLSRAELYWKYCADLLFLHTRPLILSYVLYCLFSCCSIHFWSWLIFLVLLDLFLVLNYVEAEPCFYLHAAPAISGPGSSFSCCSISFSY